MTEPYKFIPDDLSARYLAEIDQRRSGLTPYEEAQANADFWKARAEMAVYGEPASDYNARRHDAVLDRIFQRHTVRMDEHYERFKAPLIETPWPTAIEWLAFAVIVGVFAVVFWRL